MIHNAASQGPTPIDPPTGSYRVLVWTGGRVEEIAERPETEEGREAAAKLFKGSQHPAALCRGTTVVKRNGRGEAHTVAFKLFAAGGTAVPVARRVAAPALRAEPTRPVEPVVAPVTPTKTVEEHAPVKKPVDAGPLCSKCGQEPRARTTSRTHPGTETYGEKCRKAALDRDRHAAMRDAKRAAKAAGVAPQKPVKKQSAPRAAAPAPTTTLADGLARVQRHAAIVARLGGVEAADQLAALVADAGGVAVVVEALTTLRGLA